MSQKDLRAAALLEQGRRQKAELDRMVKASFAHSSSSSTNTTAASSSTSRAGRMHPKDSSAKLLDADIDFARRNLRNTWLNLLFTCTFTREAQSVDGHIWNETSYSLITAYRSYISAAQNSVDPAVQAPGRRGKSAQDASRAKAEYRKFLLDEELFWQELVGRLVRLFSLDEARPNLEVLGIDAENDADTSVSSSLPTDSYASRTTRQANEPDETLSQAALLPTKRIHLITLLHRFLIFCGDLARYREMSSHDHNSDGSGSSKKSKSSPKYDFSRASAFYEQARLILPDQGNPSNQLAVVSQYNSDAFASLYHYYRALCVKTPFLKAKINLEKLLAKPTSIYLDEAARSTDDGNSIWDAVKDGQARDPQLVRRLSNNVEDAQQATEAWLKQVVILHGLFYRRGQLSHVMYLSRSVLATFSTLIRARALRADQIVQFLVTALCASWTTRLWRGAPTGSGKESSRPSSAGSEDRHRPVAVRGERSSRKRAASPETARCIEFLVTAHVLGVFNELAAVDTAETRSALESNKELAAAIQQADGQSSPVRNLTGVVRRTLPALRIVSKWIKTHLEYLQRIEKRARDSVQQYGEPDAGVVRSGMEVRPDSERPDPHHAAYTDTLEAMDKCWSQYVDLINSLRYAFPFDSLPNIGKVGTVGARALCLEEDSDMRGFAPTRKATQSTIPGGTTISFGMGEACANIEAVRPSQVHPNEEQLMRIADLMIDAKVIAESDASPIRFDDINNVFVFERESTTSAVRSGAAAAASAAALSSGRPTVKPVAVGNPEASRNRDGADVDSVAQSLRSVQVGDGGMAADGVRKAGEAPLVPSQVRAKSGMSKDELARQLFAAYPLASESSSGAGSAGSGLAVSSSNDAGLSSAGAARAHHTNFLLSNGAPISSIWAPNASDMAGAALPSHLQYGGSTNLFQQQMQQQQHMSYQPQPQSWPHAAFSQPGAGPYTETYGNTTPDPFNPHGYGASHLYPYQQQQQQHAGFSTSPLNQSQQQQRSTPQSGSTHNGDPAFGVGQNAYYAGPDSSHPPRFA